MKKKERNKPVLLAALMIMLLLFVACKAKPSDEYIEEINHIQELIDNGDYDSATKEIVYAMELDQTAPEAYLQLGYLHMTVGETEEALEAFLYVEDHIEELVEEDNKYQALLNLGNVYYQTGNYEKSLGYFNRALELNKNDAELYNAMGLTYMQLEDRVLAKENYSSAIDVDPDNFYAYGNLASLFLVEGEYKRGLNEINTALNLNAYVPQFYIIKGQIEEASGDEVAAIATYTLATELWENYGDVYYLRGQLYLSNGDYLLAVEDFSEAKDYGMIEGILGMGLSFQGLEQYDDSITAFTEYMIQLEAIDLQALYHMAVSYYQLENYTETVNTIDELLKYESDDLEAKLLKALALERMLQYDQVKIILGEILEVDPDHSEAKSLLDKISE